MGDNPARPARPDSLLEDRSVNFVIFSSLAFLFFAGFSAFVYFTPEYAPVRKLFHDGAGPIDFWQGTDWELRGMTVLMVGCVLLAGVCVSLLTKHLGPARSAMFVRRIALVAYAAEAEPRLHALLAENDAGRRELMIALLGWRSAERVGNSLAVATWVLAFSTVALVAATVALVRQGV